MGLRVGEPRPIISCMMIRLIIIHAPLVSEIYTRFWSGGDEGEQIEKKKKNKKKEWEGMRRQGFKEDNNMTSATFPIYSFFFFLFYDSYITNRPCTLQLCPRHSIIFPSWIVRRLINVPTCLINSRLVPTELGLTTLLPSLINLYDLKNNFIVVTHYYF